MAMKAPRSARAALTSPDVLVSFRVALTLSLCVLLSVRWVACARLGALVSPAPSPVTALCARRMLSEVLPSVATAPVPARLLVVTVPLLIAPTILASILDMADIKAEPIAWLMADVLMLAIPGVTVSVPLPMQHRRAGPLPLLAIILVRLPEKLPGTMTVVQVPLDLIRSTVLVLAMKA